MTNVGRQAGTVYSQPLGSACPARGFKPDLQMESLKEIRWTLAMSIVLENVTSVLEIR